MKQQCRQRMEPWSLIVQTFLLLSAPSEVGAKSLRSAESRRLASDWDDVACFMDLGKYGFSVSAESILFRAGNASVGDGSPEVLVVQDASPETAGAMRRTLVFKSADGKCNPQAGVPCARVTADAGVGQSALAADDAAFGSTLDGCSRQICSPDFESVAHSSGYAQSMAGALLLGGDAISGPKRVVSVGLGAGTLPALIHRAFPEAQQTVVELSTEVVQAASCFGGASADFETVTADGRSYIAGTSDGELDAVLVDAFDSQDRVPSCLTTLEFFRTVRSKLRKGGLLVMNAHSGTTLHNDLADLLPAARSAFGHVWLGKAPGLANVIVVAGAVDSNSTSVAVSLLSSSDGSRALGGDQLLHSWYEAAEFTTAQADQSSAPPTDASVKCGSN